MTWNSWCQCNTWRHISTRLLRHVMIRHRDTCVIISMTATRYIRRVLISWLVCTPYLVPCLVIEMWWDISTYMLCDETYMLCDETSYMLCDEASHLLCYTPHVAIHSEPPPFSELAETRVQASYPYLRRVLRWICYTPHVAIHLVEWHHVSSHLVEWHHVSSHLVESQHDSMHGDMRHSRGISHERWGAGVETHFQEI